MSTDCTRQQGNSKLLDETICSDHLVQKGCKNVNKTLKTLFGKILFCLGDTLLMKQQSVVTHTIRQSEIPASLDSSVAHKKIAGPYITIKL
jgi:hypothetical protein